MTDDIRGFRAPNPAQLLAWARDCVLNGDMTPGAERALKRILADSDSYTRDGLKTSKHHCACGGCQ